MVFGLKILYSKGSDYRERKPTGLKALCLCMLKGKRYLVMDHEGSLKERVKVKTEAIYQLKEVYLGKEVSLGCYQDRLHIETTSIEIIDKFSPHL